MIRTKVLVVGGGPGGYVAATRAGELGLDTVLVEGDRLGGTCLIRGCIPSKALIHAAGQFHSIRDVQTLGGLGISLSHAPMLDLARTVTWKDGVVDQLNAGVATLLKAAKVRVVPGWAVFSDAKTCTVHMATAEETVRAEHVILATGSEPVEIPGLPFGGSILSSSEILSLDRVPNRLLVVGAGYIGLELGTAFHKLGAEVTIVEARERILPTWDEQLTNPVRRWLEQAGVSLHLGARVERATAAPQGVRAHVRTQRGETVQVDAEHVLVTVGRRPRTRDWGLEAMAVDMDGHYIRVDNQCRTSMRNVWAIGDVVGEPMLAHKASAQGEMVAEIIAGSRRHFDPVAIPAVCFTDPEIVSVGQTPAEVDRAGGEVVVSRFPFAANGRALTMNAGTDGGFVRIVAHRADHRVLGIQAVGEHVSELVGEFAHALEMGALLDDVAGTIHAHPTLGETLHEAAQRGLREIFRSSRATVARRG